MPTDPYDLADERPKVAGPPPVYSAPSPSAPQPPIARKSRSLASEARVVQNLLFVVDGTVLPDRCVYCNDSVDDGRRTRIFYQSDPEHWTRTAAHIPMLGKFFMLLYLLKRRLSREPVSVSFCLCRQHRIVSTASRIGMIVLIPLGIVLILAALGQDGKTNVPFLVAGIVAAVAGALCGFGINRLHVADHLKVEGGAAILGAGRKFLDSMRAPDPITSPPTWTKR